MLTNPVCPPGILGGLARHWMLMLPVLLVAGLLAWAPGFTTVGPIDRDEPRYAQASKQMLETGNFIDIRMGADPRHKKPIGIYWLQSATAATVGSGSASPIWVYRLPSLVGALGAVVLTAVVAASMYGRATGLLAGLALATTVIVSVEARLAKTDGALLAVLVLAQLALWHVWSRRQEAGANPWWLAFWLAQGVGVLIKGPIAPALSGITLLTLVAFDRRVGWIMRLKPLRGVAIAGLIIIPWVVAVLIATDGAFLDQFRHDALGKIGDAHEGHGGPPGFYLLAAWGTAWPMIVLAPLAVLWAWRTRDDDRTRFLIAWIVGFWVVFEILATKLPHYVLPTYPALAVATAAAVLSLDRRRPWLVGLPLTLGIVLGMGLAVAALALPLLLGERLPLVVVAGAVLALGFLLIVWRAYVQARHQVSVASMLAAAVVLYATVFGALFPRLETLDLSRRMAAAVATYDTCEEVTIGTAGYHEPSALFLLGTQTQLLSATGAAALLASAPCPLVFVDDRRLEAFESALTVEARALVSLEGYRHNEGRFTTITLFGKAP